MDVKSHLKKYKKGYVCGAIGVAGITYLIMKPLRICIAGPAKDLHSRTMDHGDFLKKASTPLHSNGAFDPLHSNGKGQGLSIFAAESFNNANNMFNTTVNYGGYSRKLVQNNQTGEIWGTVGEAAKNVGVDITQMSRHLNGHIPHIKNDTFSIIGIGTGN